MALRDLDSTYLGVSIDDADPQTLFDRMLTLAKQGCRNGTRGMAALRSY